MRLAALILGALSGLCGFGITFFGGGLLFVAALGGLAGAEQLALLALYGLPTLAFVGGGLALRMPTASGVVLLACAVGWFAVGAAFGQGINLLTIAPLMLSGAGAFLALVDAERGEPARRDQMAHLRTADPGGLRTVGTSGLSVVALFPAAILPWALYNLGLVQNGPFVWQNEVLAVPTAGGVWTITVGDLLVLVAVVASLLERLKVVLPQMRYLPNHVGLMVVVALYVGEFFVVGPAASSTLVVLTLIALADLAGGLATRSYAGR